MVIIKGAKIFLLLSALIWQANGARILMVFSPPSPSHTLLATSLATKLSSKGHNITLLSPFVVKDTENIKGIFLPGILEIFEDVKKTMLNANKQNLIEKLMKFTEVSRMMIETALNNNNTRELLESKETFDLVILDALLNEALLGFAHHYNATAIAFCPSASSNLINHYFNNPAPPSYITNMFINYPQKMNFLQRFANTFLSIAINIYDEFIRLPMQDVILHTYFPDAPPLKQLINNVSLVLLNSHPSISSPKPLVPNIIEIGGFHVNEPQQLPQDLKNYLDKAENGFIFFSMGSNIQSSTFSKETLQIFLNVFSKLPYNILWKFEDSTLKISSNIRIGKWLPQNDILGHPNIKLFITHGGLLSMTEAVYHGVPIVGIPVFADQETNMVNAVKLGIGNSITLQNLSEENLLETIAEVLKKNRNNVRERSRILKDQPIKPIDNAVFWIEYALRHKNAKHFKTAAIELAWYQLMLLDVIIVSVTLVFTIVFIFSCLFKKCCSTICSKSKVVKTDKEKTT